MASFVVPFEAVGRADIPTAGGKGANLGELTRAGFPVPPGFVITTAAYQRAVAQAGLAERIATALRQLDKEDAGAASQSIQQAFTGVVVPEEVAQASLAAYHALGSGPVAVRSSATAEDLADATFAGQQETFLNVEGDAALLDAVRRCWASLWSERAIAYRQRQRVDPETIALAVVVQRMVQADVAGVAFTANPVTGERDELVIDASPGLGEAVVAGLVTPDHFVLDKATFAIEERRLGRREAVVQAATGGGTTVEQPAARETGDSPRNWGAGGAEACLPDAALAELARLAVDIERHYGAPQDIEWAWLAGKPYLLQARPLTALPSPPTAATPRRRRSRLPIAGFLGEFFPIRPYPLDVSSYTSILIDSLFQQMFGTLGLRFPRSRELFIEDAGVVVRIAPLWLRPSPRVLSRPWLTLWRNRQYRMVDWRRDPILLASLQKAKDLQARDLAALSWPELLRTLHEALDLGPAIGVLRGRYLTQAIAGVAQLFLLLALTGQRRHFATLLLGGVETKTLAMNRELESVAHQARANDALRAMFDTASAADLLPVLKARPEARAFLHDFQTFLDTYGHRPTLEMLASQPAWRNAPAIPLGAIQAMVAAPLDEPVTERRSRDLPAWEKTRDDVLSNSPLGTPPLRRRFGRALSQARLLSAFREDTRFYFTLGLPVVHAAFFELGRRLAEAGALDTAADVLHLKLPEIETAIRSWPPSPATAASLRNLAVRRKARRAALAGRPFLDTAPTTGTAQGAILAGMPGSAGVAEGPVRIIREPAEFGALRHGDVLVAPFTNPTWTPLFRLAVAVVVDTGAPLSHAAIVAREYGIPAVMGTGNGTRLLRDGQRVRVDGARGLVFLA